VIETSVVKTLHRVRVQHGSTLRPLERIVASFVEPTPIGWVLAVKHGHVVISAREGVPEPAVAPVVTVKAADPLQAMRLQAPSVDITLDQPDLVHSFDPAAMTVTVELVEPDGAVAEGRAMMARGADGATVPLPETAIPGTYQSELTQWPAAFHPFDLLVGGTLVQKAAVDFTRTDTRLRVVDTT